MFEREEDEDTDTRTYKLHTHSKQATHAQCVSSRRPPEYPPTSSTKPLGFQNPTANVYMSAPKKINKLRFIHEAYQ